MDYLGNIDYAVGTNMGSVLELRVALLEDLTSEPQSKGDTLYGDYAFKPGKSFVTWKVATQRIDMESDGKETREGTTHKNDLKFIIPRDQPIIRHMLELADDDEFIVGYKDANGYQRIFGRMDRPVSFIHKRSTGRTSGDFNGFECEFYYEGQKNDYFYNQALPAPPAGLAPAIVTVNGEVVASLSPGQSINFDSDFDFGFEIIGT